MVFLFMVCPLVAGRVLFTQLRLAAHRAQLSLSVYLLGPLHNDLYAFLFGFYGACVLVYFAQLLITHWNFNVKQAKHALNFIGEWTILVSEMRAETSVL
jgi:hypothetical protein